MAKGNSPQLAASRERERAWTTLTDGTVTPQTVNHLLIASWKEVRIQEQNEGRDPNQEPNPQTGEVTSVDLLRWAAEKPDTVLGRAATLVWLDQKLTHYDGQLSVKNSNWGFGNPLLRRESAVSREAQAKNTKLAKAETRAEAIKSAVRLLTRKGATPPLKLDEQSTQYAEMAQEIVTKRSEERAERREAIHAGLSRLKTSFPDIFGTDGILERYSFD
jgi:hypothetical protein